MTVQPPAQARRHAREGLVIGLALTAALVGVQVAAYAGLHLPFVPYALAELLRDLTPGSIKTASIEMLSYGAKTLLIFVSILLYIGLGGLLAAAYGAIRERLPGNNLIRSLLVGLVAFLLTLPLEIAHQWIPADLVLGPLGVLALYLLWGLALDQTILGASARPAVPPGIDGRVGRLSRRAFLVQTAAGGTLIAVMSAAIGRLLEGDILFLPPRDFGQPGPSPTPDADGFLPARGTWSEVTPNNRFYEVQIGVGASPNLNTTTWHLKIDGLVQKPIQYSFADLMQTFKPVAPFYGTLMCVSNEIGGDLTSTALWEGWRLADVLTAAGVKAEAVKAVFQCADGYSDSLPIGVALHPDTYLVYKMNGVPLPVSHGYPLRVYIPTRYGMKNPKWITAINLVSSDYQGYWQQQGWSDEALIKHSATINPANYQGAVVMVNNATAEVGGVANGGGRGISKVEVQVDKGPWQTAILKKPLGPFTWVIWKVRFTAQSGSRYHLKVRAYDGQGNPQIETTSPPHPDGATGLHERDVFPVWDQPPTVTPSPPALSTKSA